MRYPIKTIAIAIASHKVGYIIIRNGQLIDWHTSRIAAQSHEKIQKVVSYWLALNRPDRVVTEAINPYSRKSNRTLALMQAAEGCVSDHHLQHLTVLRTRNFDNKYLEIEHLCTLYPNISPWAPRPRKCYEGEPNKYLADLFRIIREYDDFHEDNDPYGEHDFGSFEFMKQRCFWKFDYYDHDFLWASSDPSDVTKTMRVLTIMCADEY